MDPSRTTKEPLDQILPPAPAAASVRGVTSRERVLRAINHQEPDRVPVDLGGSRPASMYEAVYRKLMAHFGLDVSPDTRFNHRGEVEPFDERLLELLQVDFRRVRLRDPNISSAHVTADGDYVDEWGVTWTKEGPFWSPVGNPLANATMEDLDGYPWPDPLDAGRFEGVETDARRLYEGTGYAVVAAQPVPAYGVFMTCTFLRGMAQFMVDLAVDKDFARALMERVLRFHLSIYDRFLSLVGEYVQIVVTSDDLGTQRAMLISPAMYREMVKPAQARLLSLVKQKTDAKIFYHSCGAIAPVIPDLIEIGVDILNPVQPLAEGMESAGLKEAHGGRLVFHGGIDQQQCMTAGTPEDVALEVGHRIRAFGKGGGYILAVVHNIMPDVPPENVLALFDAARADGNYPLDGGSQRPDDVLEQ